MKFTIFYAWQSDRDKNLNKFLIMAAAEAAVKNIAADADVELAPELDHDTLGCPGTPDIPTTICQKIDLCGIFLADLTFSGTSEVEDPNAPVKYLSNPNVLIEMGYAMARVGSASIVNVMNTAFGGPEHLPFDIRVRRHPVQYCLTDKTEKQKVLRKLTADLERAFRSIIDSGALSRSIEKRRTLAEYRTVRLTLRRTRPQPPNLNTWSDDEYFISGLLTVSLIVGETIEKLFDTVIRYGELTAPHAPSEKIIERQVSKNNWEKLESASGFLMTFEPAGDLGTVKTSALYHRDDIDDCLFDEDQPDPALPQVLIYTQGVADQIKNYLQDFPNANNVMQVCTNHKPVNEQNLPTLFNVIGEIDVDILGGLSGHVTPSSTRLHHEFAIGSWIESGRGKLKLLFHYSISLGIPLK